MTSSAAINNEAQSHARKMLLKLYDKSILKKAKFAAIEKYLPDLENKVCMDIGADNGVLSYLLRGKGGSWVSADLDEHVVASIKEMVGSDVVQLDGGRTDFDDDTFDLVVIIDFLEHIHNDSAFIDELSRVMKPGAQLIINVPHDKSNSIIRKLRLALGLTDEKHGHLRPGYTQASLDALVAGKFSVQQQHTYSRFFVEFYDALISFLFEKIQKQGDSAKGTVVTAKDMSANQKKFKLFSLIYPFVWLLSKLDGLLFFTSGYSLIVHAQNIKNK